MKWTTSLPFQPKDITLNASTQYQTSTPLLRNLRSPLNHTPIPNQPRLQPALKISSPPCLAHFLLPFEITPSPD